MHKQHRIRSAFSLVEIMVTMTILSILIGISAPRVMRAVEQSHADLAGAALRSVNSAQRFYWLENRVYADTIQLLVDDGLLDNDFVSSIPRYEFAIASADAAGFQATATRRNFDEFGSAVYDGAWQGAFTIDETGTISGTVDGPTLAGFTPQLTPAF